MELWDREDYSGIDSRLNSFLFGRNTPKTDFIFDSFEDSVDNIDYSYLSGNTNDFSNLFRKVTHRLDKDRLDGITLKNIKAKNTPTQNANIVLPRDKPVIIENVSKFILSTAREDEALRQIGYSKDGHKLKQLTFTITNNLTQDLTLNLFDPSLPLDFLYSTSQNINNRINVQGGLISYTDILYNIIANPVMFHNAYILLDGTTQTAVNNQVNQPLIFKNKSIDGLVMVDPINLSLKLDTMQVAGNVVTFNFAETLNRPYIPDGMDVIQYTIVGNGSATMTFFYEQIQLKKVFYSEARNSKKLL